METLVEKYQHPILKKYGEIAKEVGGHGGMDFIMDSRLIYCLQNGLPLDMDVYDLAEWCCLAELGNYLWTITVLRLPFLILHAANGIKCKVISMLLLLPKMKKLLQRKRKISLRS